MLKIRVIPSLTIKEERLVKSVQFAEHRNIGSYISAVRVFNARDVDELTFLDLDAGKRGIKKWINEEVTKECCMPVTLGGGVRSINDVKLLLAAGADKVAMNSGALERPAVIAETAGRFGSQCAVVSIDVRRSGKSWRVFSHGGTKDAGIDVIAWAQKAESLGAGEIFLTSIDNDGKMEGYDIDLIREVAQSVRIPIIASGGAGVPHDCVRAVQAGASAVAAASIFQYTHTTPANVKEALDKAGFPVRTP